MWVRVKVCFLGSQAWDLPKGILSSHCEAQSLPNQGLTLPMSGVGSHLRGALVQPTLCTENLQHRREVMGSNHSKLVTHPSLLTLL